MLEEKDKPSSLNFFREPQHDKFRLISHQTAKNRFAESYSPSAIVHALSFDSKNPILLKACLPHINNHYYEGDAELKIARLLVEISPTLQNLINYGKILDRKNICLEAINFFEHALLKKPDDEQKLFEIYNFLGNAYLKLLDYDSAEENYHKAFTINSCSSQLHVNLGTLAIQRKDWFLVQHYFREALKFNLKNDRAWTGLAIYHHYVGDRELAISALKKALDINVTNRPALLLLSRWNDLEKISETISYISRYLDNNHFDEDISILFIHFCVQNQDFNLAEIECEKLICLNPHNIKYHEIYRELHEVNNEPKRVSENCAGPVT